RHPKHRKGSGRDGPGVGARACGSGDRVVERRRFMTGIATGLLAAPFAVEAQQPGNVYRIGYLTAGGGVEQAFRDAMRQLGYLEGQNMLIEGRSADRKLERLPDLAAELVRLKMDVIVTITTPAALAAKNATTTIPMVMAADAAPLG